MRPTDRLGGHIVTGHVDGMGSLASRRGEVLSFAMPAELARFVAVKGSITVDGVSLTVNAASATHFEVTIIPHTAQKTKLGRTLPEAAARQQVDLVARYVDRLSAYSSR